MPARAVDQAHVVVHPSGNRSKHEIEEFGKGRWKLLVHPEHICLVSPDSRRRCSFDHRAFLRETSLTFASRPLLTLRERPVVRFRLTHENVAALRSWLDPVIGEHLARTLKSTSRSALVLGLIWIAISSPWGKNALYASGFALGLAWLSLAVASAVRVHRALLAVEGVIWAWFGAWEAVQFVRERSWWAVFFVAVAVHVVVTSRRAYRFYGPVEVA